MQGRLTGTVAKPPRSSVNKPPPTDLLKERKMKKCTKCGNSFEDSNTVCPHDGIALERTDDPLLGKTLAGKYRLDERISEGGMGAVYKATHVMMDKTLAVKVLHAKLVHDEKLVARFSREARAASRINHPHAISVFDFGEDEQGAVFLVMEYLRGRTLKDVIRHEGPLEIGRAVEIAKQICDALEAAHGEGVIHRDLKSDNIMLEEVSRGGDWVKVLDFGIAKIQEPDNPDPELTAPNLIIGTPQYMSPEQCSQTTTLDQRSDIYSLGVILFEMLAGQVPFLADSPTEVMLKHLQEPPPALSQKRNDISPALEQVVLKALAKSADERFQTVGQLDEALSELSTTNSEKVVTQLPNDNQSTRRIVIATGENQAVTSNQPDEATLVRAQRPVARPQAGGTDSEATQTSFNPWQIAFASLLVLLLGFGVFYAYQRHNANDVDKQNTGLKSDPNSRPVESLAPAKGDSERNQKARLSTANLNANSKNGNTKNTATDAPGGNNELVAPPVPELNTTQGENTDAAVINSSTQTKGNSQPSPTAGGADKNPPVKETNPASEPNKGQDTAPDAVPTPAAKKKQLPKLPAPKSDDAPNVPVAPPAAQ